MAQSLELKISGAAVLEAAAKQNNLTAREIQQVGSVGINRTLATIESQVVKRLAAEINLRQREIREGVTTQKANFQKLQGAVVITRRPIPLIDFIGTRQTADGVSVQILANGPRQVLKHTFIARMQSPGPFSPGHQGVFERAFKAGARAYGTARVGRLPIEERFGLTLTGYLDHAPKVLEEEKANALDELTKNIASQVQRRLAARIPT